MKRICLRTAAVLAATYASAGIATAQTTSSATSNAPVIYAGCLKSGTDLASGTALTPGSKTSAPLSGYVLTSAQLNPNASPTSDTPPSTMTPPSTSAGAMYRIVGLEDKELQKFANQRVELRGVMESSDTTATTGTTGRPTSSQPASTTTNPATGTSGTTAAVGTSSGSAPAAGNAVPTFRATSIRMLSPSCSGGTN